jgi:DNA repair protein RadC
MDEIKRISIKEWDNDDRPREKMLVKGRKSLSNAELIAIIMGSGNREESAVELSKRVLNSVDNDLISLGKLSIEEMMRFKGIGEAKAISIAAAMEIGRRRREAEVKEKKKIGSSKDVFEVFQPNMADLPYEEFWVLLLNRANKIIGKYQVSQGGVSGTVADPKLIFNIAISNLASSIILCHNHPSGNINPSNEDTRLTKKIGKGCELLELKLLDHIIIGDQNYYSYADDGTL